MGVLDGVRVLDLGVLVQGPQSALMLVELGAEVIKVELPGFGDIGRWIPVSATDRRAPFFEACNRGKRSITLDLRSLSGKEVFDRLVDTTDVVISNFKPGTLEEWGIGYETASVRNPGIIYAEGSTFGTAGPRAQMEGVDILAQAAGGLISATGVDGGPPTPVGATIADHIASQNMTVGVLAALLARGSTGRGQRVEVSLLGGQVYAQAVEYTYTLMTGENPGRANSGHPLLRFIYGIFPTADGHVAITGANQVGGSLFDALGVPELVGDARFEGAALSAETRNHLFDRLGEATRSNTTAHWVDVLGRIGIRIAPVDDHVTAIVDPDVVANTYIAEVSSPEGGQRRVIGSPIRLSQTPTVAPATAPELGQHTEEILLEAGYDWDDITRLREADAI
jgi:crotonobetainyl-CoA:carnitine CoA-transferase CaiB-like acyl-CoA transferase